MKLSTVLEAATTVSFVKVAGTSLTVLNDKNDVLVLDIADGVLPQGTVVGSKLTFSKEGELTKSENPSFAPAAKTGKSGCLEQRVQG
ncbi:hypothetical protein D3C71_365100 [compost metagenome]|jgi:hypothetical protein